MSVTTQWTDAPSMVGREPSRANLASYLEQVEKYMEERAFLDWILPDDATTVDPDDPNRQLLIDEQIAYLAKESKWDEQTRNTLKSYQSHIKEWGLEVPASAVELISQSSRGTTSTQQQLQSQPRTSHGPSGSHQQLRRQERK